MNALTIQQVRQAVGGKMLSASSVASPVVRAVCTDTRRIDPGCLFVALRGDRFDGHKFLGDAAKGGAVAALVDTDDLPDLPNMLFIRVADTRKALGRLANFVRQQMAHCKVVAVAGSNGKTSTKHLIHSALSAKLSGSLSPKSFNNDIGVPMTIFPADPMQDFLVLEMGTNHPGEIHTLTMMAQPDIAVITNCSAEHLEGLGDLMGVRRENASIVEGLKPGGLLVINGDNAETLASVSRWAGRKITFGFGTHNDLFATDIECTDEGTSFRLNNRNTRVFVPMLGRHSATNALAAIAVARRLGVPEADVIASLALSSKPEMRLQSQVIGPVRLINDAYNANPASMRAAIETIVDLPAPGRRVAVLADMLELGDSSDRYHREIGEFVATQPIDRLVLVGKQARLLGQTAIDCGFDATRIEFFVDSESAARDVPSTIADDDLVLLKGSRSMRLEFVAEQLAHHRNVSTAPKLRAVS